MLKKRVTALKEALLPTMLLNQLSFPKDRSIVLRSVNYLQEELSTKFQCKVNISYSFPSSACNFLHPLCHLLYEKSFDDNKYFMLEDNLFSVAELRVKLLAQKKISFQYEQDKALWIVAAGSPPPRG